MARLRDPPPLSARPGWLAPGRTRQRGRRPVPATRASRLCPRPLALRCAPVFGQQRPPLVVAPAPGDLQIASREAFVREPRTPHQSQRRRVARLYVGFDAVQLDGSEGELPA